MLFLNIQIKFDSKKQLKVFFNSVKPELEERFSRSETKVASKEEDVLEFIIRASDNTALRASLNTIMKPLKLFKQLETIK